MLSWFRILVVFLISTAAWPAFAGPRTGFIDVSWLPQQIQTGSPCLFKVEIAGSPSDVHGQWQGHDIAFFRSGQDNLWYGLAGVDVEAKPGSYQLDLEATFPGGSKVASDQRTVVVTQAKYKTETLRVPNRFVEPDAETIRRIAADKEIKAAAFAHQDPQSEWSGKFETPVDSTVSEGFGTRRTFNGKLASVHRGLDYHAKTGTPIMASNSGEIVLAQELFYEGNCVVIDHGQQFMTMYLHLSKLEVSVGQKVEKGQQIGLSGGTGRATGPHLHMAVRWQGAYLDPAQLLALPLPSASPTGTSATGTK